MSSADRSEVNSRSSHRTSQGLWLSITILRPWHLDFLLMSSSGGQPYHITKQNELQSNCDSHHQLGTPMFMHILPPTVLECVMVWPVTLGDKSAPLRLDVRFILFVNCHALILIFFFWLIVTSQSLMQISAVGVSSNLQWRVEQLVVFVTKFRSMFLIHFLFDKHFCFFVIEFKALSNCNLCIDWSDTLSGAQTWRPTS